MSCSSILYINFKHSIIYLARPEAEVIAVTWSAILPIFQLIITFNPQMLYFENLLENKDKGFSFNLSPVWLKVTHLKPRKTVLIKLTMQSRKLVLKLLEVRRTRDGATWLSRMSLYVGKIYNIIFLYSICYWRHYSALRVLHLGIYSEKI